MGESPRDPISRPALETALGKFLAPVGLGLFGLLWSGGMIVGSWTQPDKIPFWLGLCLALVWLWATSWTIFSRLLPLKVVWLEEEGVRLANFESEIVVPYALIARIRDRSCCYRLVEVRLDRDSYFGRRFTFVSRAPLGPWPNIRLPPDEGVAELRRRVAAARLGRKPSPAPAIPRRSVMADAELDG